jgi:hypothetical protein
MLGDVAQWARAGMYVGTWLRTIIPSIFPGYARDGDHGSTLERDTQVSVRVYWLHVPNAFLHR